MLITSYVVYVIKTPINFENDTYNDVIKKLQKHDHPLESQNGCCFCN